MYKGRFAYAKPDSEGWLETCQDRGGASPSSEPPGCLPFLSLGFRVEGSGFRL